MNALGPNVINVKFGTVLEVINFLQDSLMIDYQRSANYVVLSEDMRARLYDEFRTHGYHLRDSSIETVLGLKLVVLSDPEATECVRLGI